MSATPLDATTFSTADPGSGLRLVLPGRGERAGAGWDWIALGWRLFARAPLMWIVALLIVIVAAILLSLVPFIGSLAFNTLSAVISAGFVVACRSLERGGDFELEHLFAGFKTHFVNLLLVGLFMVAGGIAILLVFAAFVGFGILTAILGGNTENIYSAILASSVSIALGGLVALALVVPLTAAYWFAPALVVMHGLGPGAALKASFFACFRNFLPFLVYSVVMLVFALLAAIPFALGYLVWVPLAIASTYAAYRGIFTDEDAAPAPSVTLGR